jgi:Cu-Zn family superoxide dismutase
MKPIAGLTLIASIAAGATGVRADTATAMLKNLQGQDVGTVKLSDTASGALLVKLNARRLPPGAHAFHIHEKGTCDAAAKFETAGGHLAGGKSHGVMHENGPHPGDLPNIDVATDGTAKFEAFVRGENKGDWIATANVFDADGAAVVIHAKIDDYRSQPAGDAGDRIACGVLNKK